MFSKLHRPYACENCVNVVLVLTGEYARYLNLPATPELEQIERTILRDVPRTFSLFNRGGAGGVGLDPNVELVRYERSLFNVLRAVAARFPSIGYHQGLNFIAAVLLVQFVRPAPPVSLGGSVIAESGHRHRRVSEDAAESRAASNHADSSRGAARAATGEAEAAATIRAAAVTTEEEREEEEEAYWTMSVLLDQRSMAGIFDAKSSFLQQFIERFDSLVRRVLPRLHRHLSKVVQPRFDVVLYAASGSVREQPLSPLATKAAAIVRASPASAPCHGRRTAPRSPVPEPARTDR